MTSFASNMLPASNPHLRQWPSPATRKSYICSSLASLWFIVETLPAGGIEEIPVCDPADVAEGYEDIIGSGAILKKVGNMFAARGTQRIAPPLRHQSNL